MEINNTSNRPAQIDSRTSQCKNKIFDSKIAIVSSVFMGVFGGGISYALTTTLEYSSLSYPGKVIVITVGTGVGMLSGGVLGAVADYLNWCPPKQQNNITPNV